MKSGIRGPWLRALPGLAVALVTAGSVIGYRLLRRIRRQNLQLEALQRLDSLTGLDSRVHWQERAENLLQQHLRQGRRATLMLIDVDGFKDINDRYGMAAGDDVLRGIALLVRSGMRVDSHAGRLAGDRFVVAMPATLAQTELAANRIRAAVETLHFPNFPRLHCAVSIGLAEAPNGDLGLDEWLDEAGRALLRAKAKPRDRALLDDRSIQALETPPSGGHR